MNELNCRFEEHEYDDDYDEYEEEEEQTWDRQDWENYEADCWLKEQRENA